MDFQDKVVPVPEAGCHLWTGAVGGGYGQLRWEGRQQYAHRVSYEIANGPIPVGMSVCHKCDTPTCVNPDHLFLGSMADNMRDMHRKMRSAVTRLTPSQVSDARALRSQGWSYPKLARHFGIATSSMMERLKKSEDWSNGVSGSVGGSR